MRKTLVIPLILIFGGLAVVSMTPDVVVVLVLLMFVGAMALFVLRPTTLLRLSFVLVLLASTKFRSRGAGALLAGDVDIQILFELAVYLLIAVIVFINLFRHASRVNNISVMEMLIFSYVILSILSVYWSPIVKITMVRSLQLFILFGFCFVAVRVLGVQDCLKTMTVSIVFYVLVSALLAVTFPWADGSRFSEFYNVTRFSWFSVHPILAASYSAIAAILLVAHLLYDPDLRNSRWLGFSYRIWVIPLAGILISLIAILLATRSRGALFAFLAAFFWLWMNKRLHPLVTGVLSLTAAAAIVFIYEAGLWSISAESVSDGGGSLAEYLLRGQQLRDLLTVSGRLEIWQAMSGLIVEHPIFGHGYVSTRSELLRLIPWAASAHNGLLQSLFDLGVVGAVCLWYPVARSLMGSLWRSYGGPSRLRGHYAWLAGALTYGLIYSLVSPGFAGVPDFQVLLAFIGVFVYERLAGAAGRQRIHLGNASDSASRARRFSSTTSS